MDANTTLRTNFANGMVSKGVEVRTDWNKHESSVDDAFNFIVTTSGGMNKRPGTRFLGDAMPVVINGIPNPPRLVKFEFSLGQTYILEFGNYNMRFWLDDALILNADGTVYEIATPYSYSQIKQAVFCQYKDTMFFTQWDLPIQILTRGVSATHTNWYWERLLIGEFDLAPAPAGVRFYHDGHNGFEYTVTSFRDAQESKGGNEVITTPIAEMPDQKPVWSDDIYQCFTNLMGWMKLYKDPWAARWGLPDIPNDVISLADVGNEFIVTDKYYEAYNGVANATVSSVIQRIFGQPLNFGYVFGTYTPPLIGKPQEHRNVFWSVANTNKVIPLWHLSFIRASGYTGIQDSGLGFSSAGAYPDMSGYEILKAPDSSNVGFQSWSLVAKYYCIEAFNRGEVVSGITNKILYDLIIANMPEITANNIITWDASTDPDVTSYGVYGRIEGSGSYFGLIDVVPATQLTFEHDVTDEDTVPDTSKTPPTTGQFFDTPERYPSVCTLFQQRLIVGGTKESPLMLGGSIPGTFNDFSEPDNPTETSGAFRFELLSATSNPIKHFIPIKTLYVLSEAGAFVSTVSGAVTRVNVNFNQEAFLGSSEIPPVIIERTAIYVPLNRQMVNSLNYSFTDDAFVDNNMLYAAFDLLEDAKINSLAFLRPNINLVACTTTDGLLLFCTFVPSQSFMAWTKVKTDGEFMQVCSSTNSLGYDDLFCVVKRSGKFLIERFDDLRVLQAEPNMSNSLYLDSALSGEFFNDVNIVSGLEHLEGKTVYALVDMGVQGPFTVVGGAITLENAGRSIHVGLAYESELKTLNLEPQNVVTLRGSMRRIYRAYAEVEKTGDLKYSINGGEEFDFIFQNEESLGLAPLIYTGEIDLPGSVKDNKATYVTFKSTKPLPCSVNALVAEIKYAG